MATETGIEWTDVTWNPVVGCTKVSEGCRNCYAMRMAQRLAAMGEAEHRKQMAAGAAEPVVGRKHHYTQVVQYREGFPLPQWNNNVDLVPEALTDPPRWKKPRRVFVNSMSDLFHEAVPFDFIDRVFAVMALCPQHTFQVLTKRPKRMAEYAATWAPGYIKARSVFDSVVRRYTDSVVHGMKAWRGMHETPLPNVWLGASVENQQAADERIPHLLRCPAAVRFLSLEPLLGPVDLLANSEWLQCAKRVSDGVHDRSGWRPEIGWLILGCESGPGARGHAEYESRARSIIQQADAAGVPAFHKQMPVWDGKRWRVSHDPSEWPADLRVRQWPGVSA